MNKEKFFNHYLKTYDEVDCDCDVPEDDDDCAEKVYADAAEHVQELDCETCSYNGNCCDGGYCSNCPQCIMGNAEYYSNEEE